MRDKIGIIIPTSSPERKTLLAFTELRMQQQTMKPDFIAKIDYPRKSDIMDLDKRYIQGFKECVENGCKFILFIEDDDCYPLTYIEEMYTKWIENDRPLIIGNRKTLYYHIQNTGVMWLESGYHASAHATAVSSEANVEVKLNSYLPLEVKELKRENQFSNLVEIQNKWTQYYLVSFEKQVNTLNLVFENGQSFSDTLVYQKDEQ